LADYAAMGAAHRERLLDLCKALDAPDAFVDAARGVAAP